MKSSRIVNGEGTGMYTAGIGFIDSHSGSLRAMAPAYRCSSTVPKNKSKMFRVNGILTGMLPRTKLITHNLCLR